LVPLVEIDGAPVAIGARRRSVPASIRRGLVARDECCQFPGCERYRFVDAHHIHHWAHGGETALDNLVLLCRHHHRLVHEHGYSVRRQDNGELRFCDPRGEEISPSPRLSGVSRHSKLPGAAKTWAGAGESMDLTQCVEAVLTTVLGPNLGEPLHTAEIGET
jgi:hypothetical protein